MKQNFAPNAELGELLALLQETVQRCVASILRIVSFASAPA